MSLAAEHLTVSYGERAVLHDLDLSIVDNQVTAVVGPNGCGKSTLLRTLGRLLRPDHGRVVLDGRRIDHTPTRQVARRLGLLPQTPTAPGGMTVRDLVARGRNPHLSWLRQFGSEDAAAVAHALDAVGLTDSADRAVDELSGGQRQRAWIAMVLAQQTDLLLLDEPTTYLDLAHQIEVLDLVAALHAEHGRTVVMVLHDLNLAARYAGHLVLVRDGRIHHQGPPAEVLTPQRIEEVFGLRATVLADPHTGGPLVVPRPTGS
ncbi:ABC transporter ATP-binding protein [Actinocatenispora rupis]|uniref:Iron-enterobactin transporter ATP-binding protein n=1 Tax=Actinocatenispora rupis TaxID=519421 RepID=A0A8J3NBX3_9ACTN|nr:ABC transporter ATP-binding protein [Actinocatenispora rupis]GID13506.1 iron-enterobactin transporter ATP-binding protein [Actinocatenispora rupis]